MSLYSQLSKPKHSYPWGVPQVTDIDKRRATLRCQLTPCQMVALFLKTSGCVLRTLCTGILLQRLLIVMFIEVPFHRICTVNACALLGGHEAGLFVYYNWQGGPTHLYIIIAWILLLFQAFHAWAGALLQCVIGTLSAVGLHRMSVHIKQCKVTIM